MSTQLAVWGYEEGLITVPMSDNDQANLATDGSAYGLLIRKIGLAEGEEARRRLFWQIVFYEMYATSVPSILDSKD